MTKAYNNRSPLRQPAESVELTNLPFAKYVARKHGVSQHAVATAIRLIFDGIEDALINGYRIKLLGVGSFYLQEHPSRRRLNSFTGKYYISGDTVTLRFIKSVALNARIRKASEAKIARMATTPTARKLVSK